MTANSLKGLHQKTDYYDNIDMNKPYSFSFNKTNDFHVLDNKMNGYLTEFEKNIHSCSIEQAEEFMQQLVDKIEQSTELRCEEFKFVPTNKGWEVSLGDKSNGYRLTAHFIHPVFRENDNFYLSILLTDIIKSSYQINSMAVKQIEKYYQDGLLTKKEVIAILMKENGWEFPQAKQIADYYERVYVNQSKGNDRNIASLNSIFDN